MSVKGTEWDRKTQEYKRKSVEEPDLWKSGYWAGRYDEAKAALKEEIKE